MNVNYPNKQKLTSTARTQTDLSKIMQKLTCDVLGIIPPDYSQIRIDWPTQGQPFQNADKDIGYIACVLEDGPYSRIRERQYESDNSGVTEIWTYTRIWRISWVLYGPNSFDRTRALHSALYMDYFNDVLNGYSLFPVADTALPLRIPEQLNAQWFERSDFYIILYEGVNETIQDGIAKSVEVLVEDKSGQLADITVST
jgi:hypothetical protein